MKDVMAGFRVQGLGFRGVGGGLLCTRPAVKGVLVVVLGEDATEDSDKNGEKIGKENRGCT